MSKKKRYISTTKLVNDLKLALASNPSISEDSRENRLIDSLQKKVEEDVKEYRGMAYFALICMFLMLGALAYAFYADSVCAEVESQMRRRSNSDSIYRVIMEPTETGFLTYRINEDGSIKSYRMLMREIDSLNGSINQLRNEDYRKQTEIINIKNSLAWETFKLDYLQNEYSIELKENKDKMWAVSPQIDSALILLRVYRDRMEFDSIKRQWIIKN